MEELDIDITINCGGCDYATDTSDLFVCPSCGKSVCRDCTNHGAEGPCVECEAVAREAARPCLVCDKPLAVKTYAELRALGETGSRWSRTHAACQKPLRLAQGEERDDIARVFDAEATKQRRTAASLRKTKSDVGATICEAWAAAYDNAALMVRARSVTAPTEGT